MNPVRKILMGVAAAALVVAGCSDDPALYVGGPAGSIASLQLSASRLDLKAGASGTIGAQARDAVGNPVAGAVTFVACDAVASVADAGSNDRWASIATVTANALGRSCLTATVGGVTDTVFLYIDPAAIVIAGPDTVGSGNSGVFDLTLFSVAAATLSPGAGFDVPKLVSADASRLGVDADDADPLVFSVSGRGPGVGQLQVTASNGVAAVKDVVIVAGVYGGSMSAASGAGGLVVSLNRAADGPLFDSDTELSLDGVSAYVELVSDDQLDFAVPATGVTGTHTVLISNMDADQLAQEVDFDVTKATEDQYAPGNYATTGAPELADVQTANGNVYLVHGGFGTGSASRGAFNGGPQPDHYFAVTAGASDLTFDALLEWTNGSDVDIYVCNNDLSSCPFQFFSGSSSDEVADGITIPAGETYWFIISMWSAGTDVTNFRLSTGL